jgi:mono/diheme cytochrome c family protein
VRRLIVLVAVTSLAIIASCGGRQAAPAKASSETNATVSTGENLFAIQCSQCHRLNEMNIGPALRGTLANWGGDTARYKAFIKNSQAVIGGGDAYAVKLFDHWGKTVMPAQDLTEAELDALVEYMNP